MTNETDFPQLTEVLNQETPTINKLPIFYSLFTIKRFREENEFLDIKATAFDLTPRENFVYCIPFYKRISKCF